MPALGAPPLPVVIDGHAVSPEEMGIFVAYNKMLMQPGLGMTRAEIAAQMGISSQRLSALRSQPWWAAMTDRLHAQTQNDIYGWVNEMLPKLTAALTEIVEGRRADDRSVNAVRNLFRDIIEMGKRPMIDRRPVTTNFNVNARQGQVAINVMHGWSREQKLEYARTGVAPGAVEQPKLINPRDGEDVDIVEPGVRP